MLTELVRVWDADRNISLAAPFADSSADALVPMVGLSSSVQITAVVTTVTSDGIAPGVGTSQGTRIDSVIAELTVDARKPEYFKRMRLYLRLLPTYKQWRWLQRLQCER
jgi:hypothetical protein